MSRARPLGGLDSEPVPMGDRAFLTLNSRLEPDQLQPGMVSVSENGRMDRGSWQPRRAHKCVSGVLQIDGDPLCLPFYLVDLAGGKTITSASRVTTLVTVTLTGHGFQVGSTGYLGIESLTGTVSPNGVRLVTIVDANTFTFVISGATGSETYGGTGKVRSVLDDSAAAVIWGSCLFSDPSSSSAESIIIAASGEAYLVSLASGAVTTITYPTGEVLTASCDMIQEFDRVRLRRDGLRAWDWVAGGPAFTEVASGVYTQPQVFEATGHDVDVVSGLVTVTVVGNTTVAAGDRVTIYGSDDLRFAEFVGSSSICTAATATAISFYLPIEDLSTIGGAFLSVGKPVSVGAGFIHEPGAPWGTYHQRRSIVPYRYTVGGNNTTPTFTDRDVRDELAISDILDPDTYDVISNQFRITAGTADFTVAVQPFYEDAALVFNRNSIHGMFGLSGSLTDTSVRELTREIGCLARKTIAQHGSEILFLSDNGVYGIGFFDQYNLRGVDVPLSEPIQREIDRINADLAAESVGVFFANRYYVAVPLDSTVGAGDATGNNAILVYNFQNQGWESVDFVADTRWNVLNFHIGRAGERNDLYAVNTLGGVHRLDAVDYDFDEIAVEPGGAVEEFRVASLIETRQFDGDSLDRKRFNEVQAQVESNTQDCDGDFAFIVEDSDTETSLGSISTVLGTTLAVAEGASLRVRTGGQRGQGASVTFLPTSGRPKLKSVKVSAVLINQSTTSLT